MLMQHLSIVIVNVRISIFTIFVVHYVCAIRAKTKLASVYRLLDILLNSDAGIFCEQND